MLDARDKAGCLSFEERQGFFQHRHIKVNLIGQEDDPVLLIDRRMAHVDEHVGRCQGIECKVAGTVTGITADDDVKPRLPQGRGVFSGTPFQPGRELESDPLCPPLL